MKFDPQTDLAPGQELVAMQKLTDAENEKLSGCLAAMHAARDRHTEIVKRGVEIFAQFQEAQTVLSGAMIQAKWDHGIEGPMFLIYDETKGVLFGVREKDGEIKSGS